MFRFLTSWAMRVKRNKSHRRIMRFYRLAFGVQEPYRVIVDGTFLTHALQSKFHVKEQLPKMLEARCTPVTTGCVMAELRSLGGRALGAAIIAKGYYRVQCGHETPVGASRCIAEQVGKTNERRFLVATQDAELAQAVRAVPGVPLIRLDGPVPRVEEPSSQTRGVAKRGEDAKLQVAAWERPKLPELIDREAKAKEAAAAPRKRKGPKGVNPLSCRKAKKQAPAAEKAPAAEAAAPQKAKRVRSRKMGTRTRAEVDALRSSEPIPAASAEAPPAAEVEDARRPIQAKKRRKVKPAVPA